MNRGVVVIGYPGVGKSTLSDQDKTFVDLESSDFVIGTEKIKNWEILYSNLATSIAVQNRVVFVSSHKVVRDHLLSLPKFEDVDIMAVVPSVELKDDWIQKLKDRCGEFCLAKDYYAYQIAKDHYEEDIQNLKADFAEKSLPVVELTSLEYDLRGLILNCIFENFHFMP